jgi:phospholipid/cholesterol/gamma-HCH transport system substrate-binding protein
MMKINNGQGTIGMLIQDTSLVNNIDETIINLKESSIRLNENMKALRHNFLLRGYFRRQAREKEKMQMESDSVIPLKNK